MKNPVAAKLPQFPHDPELTQAMKELKNLVSKNPELYNSHREETFLDLHEKAERIKSRTIDIRNLFSQVADLSQTELHASTIEVEQSEPQRKKRQAVLEKAIKELKELDKNNNLPRDITQDNPYDELTSAAQPFVGSSYFSRKTIEAV